MSNTNQLTCLEKCDLWWEEHKYNLIGKGGMITIAGLNSIFTFLDLYTGGSYTIAKYTALGLLNVGIVASGYIYSRLQLKAELMEKENSELKTNNRELIGRNSTTWEYRHPDAPPSSPNSPNLTPSASS